MKLIYVKNVLTAILRDGTVITKDCTGAFYDEIVSISDNEELVIKKLLPNFAAKVEEFEKKKETVENLKTLKEEVKASNIISTDEKGRNFMTEVSTFISLPTAFVDVIIKAEKEGNEELIQTYKNFWTLCCLNPDERARDNMFWFLTKYGFKISKSGLFVAYRNADIISEGKKDLPKDLKDFILASHVKVKTQKKSPKNFTVFSNLDLKEGDVKYILKKSDYEFSEDSNVESIGNLQELYEGLNSDVESAPLYTDNHTKTFKIRLGEMVTQDRSLCNPKQDVTCSEGLHVASKEWLEKNGRGFGVQGLMVLVNPVDVVAVPKKDSYGKMRTCAYLPILPVKKDSNGYIIEEDIPDGFEDKFFNIHISYEGEPNKEDIGNYTIEVPDSPTLNTTSIKKTLQDIKGVLAKKIC